MKERNFENPIFSGSSLILFDNNVNIKPKTHANIDHG